MFGIVLKRRAITIIYANVIWLNSSVRVSVGANIYRLQSLIEFKSELLMFCCWDEAKPLREADPTWSVSCFDQNGEPL